MERQWSIVARTGRSMALAILDLDDFKRINDSSGHAAGDLVLRQAATTIAAYIRRVRPGVPHRRRRVRPHPPDTDTDGAQVLVRRLLAACLDGEQGRGAAHTVSFSAGISSGPVGSGPGTARDRETLYRQADSALFWSKRHGRTCVTIYDPARHVAAVSERPAAELSAAVAQVAATGAIRAVFQPIFDLTTGAPRGYEGLVRPLPDSGFADAGSMFEAAEASGRTGELDIACLNTVMETAARLRLPGSLTVNLSPRTLERDDFSVHALLRMIVRHGLDPRLHRRRADRARGRRGRRATAPGLRGLPRGRDPPRGRRRRRRERGPAAPEPAPLRHREDRPIARPGRRGARDRRWRSSRPCATSRTAGARWSSPRASRPRPSSRSSARSGSGPDRATSWAARPIDPRPSRSTSPGLVKGADWLIERLRTMPT